MSFLFVPVAFNRQTSDFGPQAVDTGSRCVRGHVVSIASIAENEIRLKIDKSINRESNIHERLLVGPKKALIEFATRNSSLRLTIVE